MNTEPHKWRKNEDGSDDWKVASEWYKWHRNLYEDEGCSEHHSHVFCLCGQRDHDHA